MRAFRLGLTGSIGMGKLTTAGMFRDAGVPVWDADAAVHRLYAAGGAAVAPLAALHPAAAEGSAISRARLRDWIAADPGALAAIEGVVHPLVAADRAAFLARADAAGAPLVVLDIPLLYETAADAGMDAVLVVTAPAQVQRARVLARPGMTEAEFSALLARQMPDAEKRARARYVLETLDMESAREQVDRLVQELTGQRDA